MKEGSVTLNSLPSKCQSEETLDRLHLNGLNLLGDILRIKNGEPETKMQYQLAGMVALTILLVEKLKHLHLSQNKSLFYTMLEYAITLLGSFTTNCTATVVQIADKCGLFKLLIDFLEQLGAFRVVRVHEPAPLQNKILSFFHTCLPLVSPRTMLLIFSCAKITGDPEIN